MYNNSFKALATPPKSCADKIPHCDVYNDNICTNEKYRSWAEENRPAYYMICSTSDELFFFYSFYNC